MKNQIINKIEEVLVNNNFAIVTLEGTSETIEVNRIVFNQNNNSFDLYFNGLKLYSSETDDEIIGVSPGNVRDILDKCKSLYLHIERFNNKYKIVVNIKRLKQHDVFSLIKFLSFSKGLSHIFICELQETPILLTNGSLIRDVKSLHLEEQILKGVNAIKSYEEFYKTLNKQIILYFERVFEYNRDLYLNNNCLLICISKYDLRDNIFNNILIPEMKERLKLKFVDIVDDNVKKKLKDFIYDKDWIDYTYTQLKLSICTDKKSKYEFDEHTPSAVEHIHVKEIKFDDFTKMDLF